MNQDTFKQPLARYKDTFVASKFEVMCANRCMKPERLAEAIQVPPAWVKEYFRGEIAASFGMIHNMAQVLIVPMAEVGEWAAEAEKLFMEENGS